MSVSVLDPTLFSDSRFRDSDNGIQRHFRPYTRTIVSEDGSLSVDGSDHSSQHGLVPRL